MLIVGILQCFGACWVYRVNDAFDAANKTSVWVLGAGYWAALLIFGALGVFIPGSEESPNWPLVASIIAFWVWMLVVWGVSYVVAGCSFSTWYKKVFFYGASDLAISMSNLSHSPDQTPFWVKPFEFWWSFSMKYFFSWAVWVLVMRILRSDLPILEGETMYSGYHWFWQLMGFLYPIAGLAFFFVGLIFCTTEEEFEHDKDAAMRGERQDGKDVEMIEKAGMAIN